MRAQQGSTTAYLGVLAPGRVHDQDCALVPAAVDERGQLIMRERLHIAVAVPEVALLLLRLLRCAGHHVARVQPAFLARGILCSTQACCQQAHEVPQRAAAWLLASVARKCIMMHRVNRASEEASKGGGADAHLPPPSALTLMLVGQHWAGAWFAANGHISARMQLIGRHTLQTSH